MKEEKDQYPIAKDIVKSDQYDIENQQNQEGSQNVELGQDWQKQAQLGFIRKVFGIVTAQLLFTCIIVGLVIKWPPLTLFFFQNQWIIIPSLMMVLGSMIPLLCCPKVAKEVPTNYIMLLIFTFGESIAVASVCVYYDPQIVLAAAVMTTGVTLALAAYSCYTTTDFSVCYAGCWIVISALMLVFFFLWMFGSTYYSIIAYCGLGVIVYGFYIIVDVQVIIGKGRVKLSYDDYILGALMLYLDIINLFLHILRALGKRR